MKYILIIMTLISLSCGVRKDEQYFACNDNSGSNKCRSLDQQELAKFLISQRDPNYQLGNLSSQTQDSDKFVIQTFLLRESQVANSNHSSNYYDSYDVYRFYQQDYDLSTFINNYDAILNEEGPDRCHAIQIYGNEYQNLGGQKKLLYKEEIRNCK